MWLKIIIILLFLSLVASLVGGFAFLVKDQGSGARMRLWNSLSLRLLLAFLLIGFLSYGIYTDQLHSQAPWGATSQIPPASTR